MQPVPVSLLQPVNHARTRTALVASADRSFRQRLTEILTGLRWQVREVEGGAQAWSEAETSTPEAIIVDSWLPDLDLTEFIADFRGRFPHVDVVSASGEMAQESPRGPFRQELLYALRRSQDTDTAAWNAAPALKGHVQAPALPASWPVAGTPASHAGSISTLDADALTAPVALPKTVPIRSGLPAAAGGEQKSVDRLPELIGNAHCMLEVSRRIRLVAARMTPVLIEGPTGSGKELVAEALHRLSMRSKNHLLPLIALQSLKRCLRLNCSATPAEPLPARCRDG
jgi:CheY-like chemotaxis protein